MAGRAPAWIANREVLRQRRTAYRHGDLSYADVMIDPNAPAPPDMDALRATFQQFKRDQQTAAERPPRKAQALAALAPDFDRAEAGEAPGRAEAERIRPRLAAVTTALSGLHDHPRYDNALTWVRNARGRLEGLLQQRDEDARRIAAIRARAFEGHYDVRDA